MSSYFVNLQSIFVSLSRIPIFYLHSSLSKLKPFLSSKNFLFSKYIFRDLIHMFKQYLWLYWLLKHTCIYGVLVVNSKCIRFQKTIITSCYNNIKIKMCEACSNCSQKSFTNCLCGLKFI